MLFTETEKKEATGVGFSTGVSAGGVGSCPQPKSARDRIARDTRKVFFIWFELTAKSLANSGNLLESDYPFVRLWWIKALPSQSYSLLRNGVEGNPLYKEEVESTAAQPAQQLRK